MLAESVCLFTNFTLIARNSPEKNVITLVHFVVAVGNRGLFMKWRLGCMKWRLGCSKYACSHAHFVVMLEPSIK